MTSFWIMRCKTQASRGHCSPSLAYRLSVHECHAKSPEQLQPPCSNEARNLR